MLSDAEETLTDTDKAGAVGASSDPNAASLPITAHKNDQRLRKGVDEDSTAFKDVLNTEEEDAYNDACLKVVCSKRRARNAAALEAASPLPTDLENPQAKPRPNALLKVQELSLGQCTYPVSAYLAAPDDSCKGIVPGLEPGTTSHSLVEELQATRIQILQARMMGQTNIAVITFEGLHVPRFVRFLGAELCFYLPPYPRMQVCKTCLELRPRAYRCPTPDVTVCEQCGVDNPKPSHPCSLRCKFCEGDHATTDPQCPRVQRQPFNRSWV
ncbi:hypothetical protein HPB51_029756 [Rhipicephalus microplus]|uniref:Uncharacterized protein n=1 Tax=Rhipicephalus microplus TaxID=6941 RepID=A0A9J6CT10_RHIMP|nr:hypothetical protein HPB51_029756 [Rhipicephalus microplus]